MQRPFPLLSDLERYVDRTCGPAGGFRFQTFIPGTIWTYLKLLLRGRRYTFIAGKVRFEHRSVPPHDRPLVEELLGVLEGI
jgi:hypothetical protein